MTEIKLCSSLEKNEFHPDCEICKEYKGKGNIIYCKICGPELEHVMKWISVKYKMPELGDRVLVFDSRNDIIYMGQCIWFQNRKEFCKDGFQQDMINSPTHWMPLPSYPTSQEELPNESI